MDKHKLIVDSVVVRFGRKTVLSGGYITSETGMVTGLLGRNGAGKSCMFRALMGGLSVENVMVSIDGKWKEVDSCWDDWATLRSTFLMNRLRR